MSDFEIVVGEGPYQRDGAPEPALLPHLASVTRHVELCAYAAHLAARFAADREGGFPVPALADAVAQAICERADLGPDAMARAAGELPLIGAYCDADGDEPLLRAYVAARHGDLVAVEAAADLAGSEEEHWRIRAAGLRFGGDPLPVLDWVRSRVAYLPHEAFEFLAPLAARLDPPDQDGLVASIAADAEPRLAAAALVAVLPAVRESARARAAAHARRLLRTAGPLERWRAGYARAAMRDPDRGIGDLLLAAVPEARHLQGEPMGETSEEAFRRMDNVQVAMTGGDGDDEFLGARGSVDSGDDDFFGPPRSRGSRTRRPDDSDGDPDGDERALYLDAHVHELSGDGPQRRTDAFVRGAVHRIDVALATKTRATGITADAPVPIDTSRDNVLWVSFFADWLPPTERQELRVRAGDEQTGSVGVDVTVPDDLDTVEIQVTIEDETKVLQQAMLVGDVVDAGATGDGEITLRVFPAGQQPAEPQERYTTLVLGNEALAIHAAGPAGEVRELGAVMDYRARLGDKVLTLGKLVTAAADEAKLADALGKLAAAGKDVWNLLDDALAGQAVRDQVLDGDGPLQLVSDSIRFDIPVEFVYDGPRPDAADPQLCEEFFPALQHGACRECPNRGAAICAFDFWGFRRRIERRVVDKRDAAPDVPPGGRVATSELPAATAPAVLGLSAKFADPKFTRHDLLDDLAARLNVAGPLADWDEWVAALAGTQHRLLALLSHTQPNGEAIEMGGVDLERGWVDRSHVNPSDAAPGPVVLLTGCETGRPDADFLSFVALFLKHGAAVVVATLAQIRADVSAEASLRILETLQAVAAEQGGPRTVGEVMRRARCRLLAQQDLTGLNLLAYGDADWVLA